MKVHEDCRLKFVRKSEHPPVKKRKINYEQVENELPILSSCSTSDGGFDIVSHDSGFDIPSHDSGFDVLLNDNDKNEVKEKFDFKNNCFICGKRAYKNKEVVHVITEKCLRYYMTKRNQTGDEKDLTIIRRLQYRDPTCECMYHEKCRQKFLASSTTGGPSKIRKDTQKIDEIVQQIIEHIESSGKFKFHVNDFQHIIGEHTITNLTLFDRLKMFYQKKIDVQQGVGKKPVIFVNLHVESNVFRRWFLEDGQITDHEKKLILHTAADILKSESKPPTEISERYPPAEKFFDDINCDVPTSITEFIKSLIYKEKRKNVTSVPKIDSICHSLTTLMQPKFSSKLQLALGVYILRKTGKKQIVDILYKLGVCVTYDAVQLYESSIVLDPPVKNINENTFVQFVFDNTDHNVCTLDGKETFHCLGGISAFTPHYNLQFEGGPLKLKRNPLASRISSKNEIPIKSFDTFSENLLKDFIFRSTNQMNLEEPSLLPFTYGAYLWCRAFKVPSISSWKGFMEIISYDVEYEKSVVHCEQFINLPPSDLTTLNTALHYAAEQCQIMKQKTCFATFDQPLYFKARCIVAEGKDDKLKNTHVRLGGFHFLMSYFGSIGFIMDGSGLEELWLEIYAPRSIKLMMTGHAFARALRAHILTFTAIGIHICRMIETTETEEENFFALFETIWNPSAMDNSAAPPDLNHSIAEQSRINMAKCNYDPTIQRLTNLFISKIEKLGEESPTAKLWLQYFKSLSYALQFIEAERLGNFKLHLQSVRAMLPLFHASGHFAYAKSGQIYLQDAEELEGKMTETEYYSYANNGYFTIRRSDKPFSGLWSDMIIECTLNRFFGTDLRHGRGVMPSVVTRYLAAMPSAFSIMENLENYCGVRTTSSEQHVDLNKSRLVRDLIDINKLLSWLDVHKPFAPCTDLKSVGTGLIADKTINCHLAFEKGQESMERMIGKKYEELSLSKIFTVKPLSSMKNSAHLSDAQFLTVDTNLLFQRLITTFDLKDTEKIKDVFTYELAPFPPCLFDESGLMRKTNKAELYKIMLPDIIAPALTEFQFVVDGGWLLRKVVWPHSATYTAIFSLYLSYIHKHFRDDCIIVFDGYSPEDIGTKSYER